MANTPIKISILSILKEFHAEQGILFLSLKDQNEYEDKLSDVIEGMVGIAMIRQPKKVIDIIPPQ